MAADGLIRAGWLGRDGARHGRCCEQSLARSRRFKTVVWDGASLRRRGEPSVMIGRFVAAAARAMVMVVLRRADAAVTAAKTVEGLSLRRCVESKG